MTEINKTIGVKIKNLRKGLGMSQMELAEKMNLSFQQIQKYEKGITRMPVERLKQLSDVLNVNVIFFFEQTDTFWKVSSPDTQYNSKETPEEFPPMLSKKEIIFLKLFRKIKNRKIKDGLLTQLKGIAALEKTTQKTDGP